MTKVVYAVVSETPEESRTCVLTDSFHAATRIAEFNNDPSNIEAIADTGKHRLWCRDSAWGDMQEVFVEAVVVLDEAVVDTLLAVPIEAGRQLKPWYPKK